MRRRLLNILTALSLLLCVAVVVLWVRSYSRFEQAWYARVPFAISINSQQGSCKAEWTKRWPGLSYGLVTQHKALRPVDRDRGSHYFMRECSVRVGSFGFGRAVHNVGNPGATTPTAFTIVTAPHWGLGLAAAVPPALLLFRWHRRRRRPLAGHCRSCGYDLTGNVSGVCPECGDTLGTGGRTAARARKPPSVVGKSWAVLSIAR